MSVKFFTENDGFRTDREIDTRKVEMVIAEVTGIELTINRNH
jgi:hypothetical protein